jgi:hypothetical protein
MATTSSSGEQKPTTRRTAARKPAGSSTRSRRTTAATKTTATEPATRVKQAQHLAERVILVPVGAGLTARDSLVSTVGRYGTRTGLERELARYEKRGVTARNRFERQVRKTRKRFEREMRQRRGRLERTFEQNRRRLEREVRSMAKDIGTQTGAVGVRAQKLVANAQGLIGPRL